MQPYMYIENTHMTNILDKMILLMVLCIRWQKQFSVHYYISLKEDINYYGSYNLSGNFLYCHGYFKSV